MGSSTEPCLAQADLPGAAGMSDKDRLEFTTAMGAEAAGYRKAGD